ncbi:MAG: hypothetical protein GY833_24270 [Aestuariibacter sp.]|nr:hypothetical protein [Aestuariibacter sp.]
MAVSTVPTQPTARAAARAAAGDNIGVAAPAAYAAGGLVFREGTVPQFQIAPVKDRAAQARAATAAAVRARAAVAAMRLAVTQRQVGECQISRGTDIKEAKVHPTSPRDGRSLPGDSDWRGDRGQTVRPVPAIIRRRQRVDSICLQHERVAAAARRTLAGQCARCGVGIGGGDRLAQRALTVVGDSIRGAIDVDDRGCVSHRSWDQPQSKAQRQMNDQQQTYRPVCNAIISIHFLPRNPIFPSLCDSTSFECCWQDSVKPDRQIRQGNCI